MEWVLLLATFLIAGMAQRITGIGFALIATPIAVVLIGAEAVSSVAVLGAISSAAALIATRRQLQWREALPVVLSTVLWMLPMIFLVQLMSASATGIAAGALVIAATVLAAMPLRGALATVFGSRILGGALVAASASMAGLGGPAGAAHGTVRQWGEAFVPNLQVLLLATTPFVVFAHGWPASLDLLPFAASAAAVAAGTFAGSWARSRINGRLALLLTRILAVIGGVFALIGGIASL